MRLLVMNTALAIVWAFLTANVTAANIIVGFIIGFAVLWLAYRGMPRQAYFGSFLRIPGFLAYFLWELLRANLRIAYDIVTPRHHMRPGVVAVPLDVKTDVQITALANLITLTPGTLTLDVSEDGRTLYLHVMYLTDPDDLRASIKQGMERRVLEMT